MAWSFADVLDYLQVNLSAKPARTRGLMDISIEIENRGQHVYEAPRDYSTRSAHIRFMERDGWGLFVVTLGALFPRSQSLTIKPGGFLAARVPLGRKDLASRTQILHYKIPQHVRNFQVFLPLAADDADGYRNMISANSADVRVTGSWLK